MFAGLLPAAIAPVAEAAELSLRPISATGSYTVLGDTIWVEPNSTITLEYYVHNWGAVKLRGLQIYGDPAGYTSGTAGSLSPLVVPDATAGAFITTGRSDFVHFGYSIFMGVDTSTPVYRWFTLVDSANGPLDPGGMRYTCTLKLVASSDASGVFIVGPDTNPANTYALDETSTDIPISAFHAATIVVGAPSPAGLIAWWDADASSAPVAVDIQNGHNGTMVNGATLAPGYYGQAFSFDGVDDYITVPSSPPLQFVTNFSVSAWAKADVVTGTRTIVSRYDVSCWNGSNDCLAYILRLEDAVPRAYFAPGLGLAMWVTGPAVDTGWHHYAITYTNTSAVLYVDAVAVDTIAMGQPVSSRLIPTAIGANSVGSENFDGLIDEVQIFDRALSAPEVQAIYAGRRFVDADATGANNGSSWADAYQSLQDGLAAALPGSEIWVAAGMYRPDRGTGLTLGDRTATFQLKSGVALFGGFNGTETSIEQRDLNLNVTSLSGDLNDNDSGGHDDPSRAENAYHVVTGSLVDDAAILDGFVVIHGNANGSGANSSGGGIYNDGGSPRIHSSWVTWNRCDGSGGGVYNANGGNATFANSFIDVNYAANGGGMANVSSSPNVINVEFAHNIASAAGGGMFNVASNPFVYVSTFQENAALHGGAMANQIGSIPELLQVRMYWNVGDARGGVMFNQGDSRPELRSCVLSANTATVDGGAMYNDGSYPVIINSILWDNAPNEMTNVSSLPTVSYSDVEGGFAGVGNVNADPLFTDPQTGSFGLSAGSPCIDAGDNRAAAGWLEDAGGSPRFYDDPTTVDKGVGPAPIIDIGLYEYFDCNGNGIYDACDLTCAPPCDVPGCGLSADCNENLIPDSCENRNDCDNDNVPNDPVCGEPVPEQDCDNDNVCNGVEIATCPAPPLPGLPDLNAGCRDCTGAGWSSNGIPDACDIAACAGNPPGCADCTGNGIPDGCEPDCNSNLVADSCDIAGGTSIDCNLNGTPDECEVVDCVTAVQAGGPIDDPATFGGTPAENANITVGSEGIPLLGRSEGVTVVDVNVNATIDTARVLGDGVLTVTGQTVGDLLVTQTGGVLIHGKLWVGKGRTIDASAGAVTLGAGGIYEPAPGETNTAVELLANNVTIQAGTATHNGGRVTLTDTMSVTTDTLVLDGSTVPLQCGGSVASVQGVSPLPKLEITKSATLSATQIVLAHSTDVTVGSPDPQVTEEPTITVTGAFRNKSKDPCRFNWYSGRLVLGRTMVGASGGLRVAGTEPTTLEVAGQDLGAVADGFNTGADGNFSISTLEIAPGADVTIENQEANTAAQPGPCLEALYAGTLILGPGSNLAIAETIVYYAAMIDLGGDVTVVGCGGLVPLPACTTSTECSDGLFCTGAEQCVDINGQVTTSGGLCRPPVLPCGTTEVCKEQQSRCVSTAVPAGVVAAGTAYHDQDRYLSLSVPVSGAGQETALRVRLTSLHHPAAPSGAPDFSAFEGQVRYVNTIRDGGNNVVLDCPDSILLGTTFQCATLGCQPEYRDWAAELNGALLHVTGASAIPSSRYEVAQIGLVCLGLEADCASSSEELIITTGLWGDVDAGQLNVLDVSKLVDKVKDLATGTLPKPRVQLQPAVPNPLANVNVLDIANGVDALKGKAYPYAGPESCP